MVISLPQQAPSLLGGCDHAARWFGGHIRGSLGDLANLAQRLDVDQEAMTRKLRRVCYGKYGYRNRWFIDFPMKNGD